MTTNSESAHDDEIAQEHELHKRLVNSLDGLPAAVRGGEDLHLLAFAHELRIHDAGREQFADGWADILTVNELGQVWIIEVKLATSAELNAGVWGQLIRYRDSVMKMAWRDIHAYLDRFLEGEGRVLPIASRFAGCHDLEQIIGRWQDMICRRMLPAAEIVNQIASNLREGTAGLAVVADGYNKGVISGGEAIKHGGPLAYLVVKPHVTGLEIVSKWVKAGSGMTAVKDVCAAESGVFARYQKQRLSKVTVDGFGAALHPHVAPLWLDTVEPGLRKLGWNGAPLQAERKGMILNIPLGGKPIPLIRIGYSDTDSSGVAREFKQSTTHGLRVDIAANRLRNSGALTSVQYEELAANLHKIGWRGTGTKCFWMRYCPHSGGKDFLGRPNEKEAIEAFLLVIQHLQ